MTTDEYGNKNETIKTVDSGSDSSDLEIEQSDESSESSFDSEASRINFWRDINTGDDEYTNAVIVSNNFNNMGIEDKNIFQ